MTNNCVNCIFCGYDIDLNGYCGREGLPESRKIVIDDNGCRISYCPYFKPKYVETLIVFKCTRQDGVFTEYTVTTRKEAIKFINNMDFSKYINVVVILNKYNNAASKESFNLYSERSAKYFGIKNLKEN